MCYPTLRTIVASSPVVVGTIIPSAFLLFPFLSIGTMQHWCYCYRGGASGGLFVSTDSGKVCLEVDDSKAFTWHVGAAFTAHAGMRSHTGSVLR